MLNKSLLALSLTTISVSPVHADSSVQLYGIVDAGYGYASSKAVVGNATTKTRELGVQSGNHLGSRWGMRGVEDLGNGTSAIFLLESGFNVGNGQANESGKLFDRKSYVGLTGDSWGTFTIGRQANLGDELVAGIDPFETDWSLASATSVLGDSLATDVSNSIKYVSPDFAGFSFGVLAANTQDKKERNTLNSTRIERKTDRYFSLGLAYDVHPFAIAANLDHARVKETGKENYHSTAWNLGLSYDFDVLKLHALYGQSKGYSEQFNASELAYKAIDAGVVDAGFVDKDSRRQAWVVGLSAPLSDDDTLLFSYQGSRVKNDNFKDRAKTHGFGLGYEHSFSKRTGAYLTGFYGQTKYRDNKYQTTQVSSGLVHRF